MHLEIATISYLAAHLDKASAAALVIPSYTRFDNPSP
jgi:hypothetical protein